MMLGKEALKSVQLLLTKVENMAAVGEYMSREATQRSLVLYV